MDLKTELVTRDFKKTGVDRRHGKRLMLSFPIEVRARDVTGQPFSENTVTLDISESGCSFMLLNKVQCGEVATIQLARHLDPASNVTKSQFDVIWVEATKGGWTVGVAARQPGNIWHMSFPRQN